MYEPGPDRRYHGTWYTLSPDEVHGIRRTLPVVWNRYCQLLSIVYSGQSYQEGGPYGIKIIVGGVLSGVHVRGYRSPITSLQDVWQWEQNLEYAIDLAKRVQKTTFKVKRPR